MQHYEPASLSVILPTCGRASLGAALHSVASQLGERDQVLVVGDGHQPDAHRLCDEARDETAGMVGYCEASHPSSRYGNHQRDVALELVSGSHVCLLDDDDVYTDGALDLFRAAATEKPDAVHVFRAQWGPGHHAHGVTLWSDPVWRVQNVATCMVVFPRHGLPLWMGFNDAGIVSDFGWMTAAAEGRTVEFHEQIVATVRPEARA